MLGKLIKYDFKSTSRVMWILYLGLIVVGALLGITFRFGANETTYSLLALEGNASNGITEVLMSTFGIVFVLLIQAVAIMTIVMIILRFYKNLLGGEGYLMHTLPVKTGELIGSKLIVSMIWMVIAAVAGILSVFALAGTSGWLSWLIREANWEDIKEILSGIFSLNGILTLILVLFSATSFITRCYACMGIGNLANKNKFLIAVLAYIGIGIVISIITSIIGVTSGGLLKLLLDSANITTLIVGSIVMEAGLSVVFFIVTEVLLRKKLNLA